MNISYLMPQNTYKTFTEKKNGVYSILLGELQTHRIKKKTEWAEKKK